MEIKIKLAYDNVQEVEILFSEYTNFLMGIIFSILSKQDRCDKLTWNGILDGNCII